jgi:hypothetical protein
MHYVRWDMEMRLCLLTLTILPTRHVATYSAGCYEWTA